MSGARWRGGLILLVLSMAYGVSAAQRSTHTSPTEQLQRGQYLVEHVAMCVQCHTPRNAQGELDRTRLLQGAPVPVPAPFSMSQWAFEAPKIAGLPGWMAEDAMRLLQTGRSARGYVPRPPMPPFRMTQEDAAAVVAYLKSLP
jgi:mono/diheme cytochrome c family protein